MLKKLTLGTAAALTMFTAFPAAAEAHPRGRAHGYHANSAHARSYDQSGYDQRRYANRRCRSGTTAAIVGGAAGALLGREVAGRGDRTLGTILGGAAGALGGRAITRDKNCR